MIDFISNQNAVKILNDNALEVLTLDINWKLKKTKEVWGNELLNNTVDISVNYILTQLIIKRRSLTDLANSIYVDDRVLQDALLSLIRKGSEEVYNELILDYENEQKGKESSKSKCENCNHWRQHEGTYNDKNYGNCNYVSEYSDSFWLEIEADEYGHNLSRVDVMTSSDFCCNKLSERQQGNDMKSV